MTYTIQTNAKGSRSMEISDLHLQTLEKYSLLNDLLDSNGIVDESVLEKLRLNVRSILEQNHGDSDLLALCYDVLFHDNMKAFGLYELICLYIEWKKKCEEESKEEA